MDFSIRDKDEFYWLKLFGMEKSERIQSHRIWNCSMIQPKLVSLAPVSRGTGLRGPELCAPLTNPPSTDNLPWTLKLFGLGSWVGQGGCQRACLCFRIHFLIKIQVHSGRATEARVLEAFFLNRLLQLKISV